MRMEYEKEILSIIHDVLGTPIEHLSAEKSMDELALNSISYIQLVLRCEKEFNIVFDDEQLIMSNFAAVKELIEYISFKCRENANKEL